VVGSWRYLGSALGFGFGVVWMTAGLGAAIVSLLFAGIGYGVVLATERAQSGAPTGRRASETAPEPRPGATDVEYGWSRG
jgi:hypothetical protein